MTINMEEKTWIYRKNTAQEVAVFLVGKNITG